MAEPTTESELPSALVVDAELCEYCGQQALEWRKCKQVCTKCGQINRSCADL